MKQNSTHYSNMMTSGCKTQIIFIYAGVTVIQDNNHCINICMRMRSFVVYKHRRTQPPSLPANF
jgi:hypothetical protein